MQLFAPDGVWNTAVGDSTPLDPSSDRRVKELVDFVMAQMASGYYPDLAADSYSSPLYVVDEATPRSLVTRTTGSWGTYLGRALDEGVPIPADAQPARGSDGHMTIYQPSTDTLWEFWKAVKKDDGWHASWAGAMRNVSTNAGYYGSSSWPGLPATQGWSWGSTATSLPVAAGMATLEELERGRVDHALAAAIPNPCRGYFSWPAQRHDGSSDSADCMPEGARLRLEPNLDLDRLAMPRVTRILAQAAQRYGIVVRDRTRVDGSVALFAEPGPSDQPSRYSGPGGLFESVPRWKMLSTFPWRHLQLLPMRLCTTSPCQPG